MEKLGKKLFSDVLVVCSTVAWRTSSSLGLENTLNVFPACRFPRLSEANKTNWVA